MFAEFSHWRQAFHDKDSLVSQVLRQQELNHEQTGHMDFDQLAVLGCLLCSGSTQRKVDILECIVHQGPPPEWVQPNSRLFQQTYYSLCEFATVAVFKWAYEFDGLSNGFAQIEEQIWRVISDTLPNDLNQAVF